MKRFNVLVRVIDIIDAMTSEEAQASLTKRLEAAGFMVYEPLESSFPAPDVFESGAQRECVKG